MGKMAQVHSIRVVQTSGLLLEQMAGLELMNVLLPVSYTHLTLPTKLEV